MNCEKCHELVSDLLDGSISGRDKELLTSHLDECLGCREVRRDLEAIVSFCHTQRGQYDAVPNERAMWLRIRNVIEVGSAVPASAVVQPAPRSGIGSWLGRTWEVSLPQLAASVAAIVLVVSLTTVVGLRRWQSVGTTAQVGNAAALSVTNSVLERTQQQQQLIDYWNRRVELNKARWSPQMRETFDRNLKVIDEAVNASMNELSKNPHDEVSEEMLNAALNEKLAILKEFADL